MAKVVTELTIDSAGAARGAADYDAAMTRAQNAAQRSMGAMSDSVTKAREAVTGLGDAAVRAANHGIDPLIVKLATLAGGTIVAGVVGLFVSATREIVTFEVTARRAGLELQKFQELRIAAQMKGATGAQFDTAALGIAKALNEARREETELSKLLDKNNVKFKEGTKLVIDTNDALKIAANLIRGAWSEMDKIKVADAFGIDKSLIPMLEGGQSALEHWTEEARRSGGIVDSAIIEKAAAFDREWTRVTTAWVAYFKAAMVTGGSAVDDLISKIPAPTDKERQDTQEYFNTYFDFINDVRKTIVAQWPEALRYLRETFVGPLSDAERLKLTFDAVGESVQSIAAMWASIKLPDGLSAARSTGGGNVIPFPRNRPPSTEIPPDKEDKDTKDAWDRASDSIDKHTSRLRADALAVGQSQAVHEQLRGEFQLLEAARISERGVTDEQIATYTTLRATMSAADAITKSGMELDKEDTDNLIKKTEALRDQSQALAQLKVNSEISFSRQTAFLGAEDVAIAQKLRVLYGDNVPAALASSEAAAMRLNAALKEMKDDTVQFGQAAVQAFLHGKSGTEAWAAAIDQLTSKLANKLVDKGITAGMDALFGSASSTAGMSAGATTAATILTSAGASVAAEMVAGATAAAQILGIGGAVAGTETAAGGAVGGGTLAAGGGAAGVAAAAGGTAAGAALVAGGTAASVAIWGPIAALMAVVVAAGALFLKSQSDAAKAAKLLEDQITARTAARQFSATLLGTEGSVSSRIQDQSLQRGQVTGQLRAAKLEKEARELETLFTAWMRRVAGEFVTGFGGMLDAMRAGVGDGGAFNSARSNISSLSKEIAAFIEDTKTFANALPAGALAQAQDASRALLLAQIEGAPELSAVATEMARIAGTASALQAALVATGMSASAAATAISDRMGAALDKLRVDSIEQLNRDLNDAAGKGFLNDLSDLVKDIGGRKNDLAGLGVDTSLLDKLLGDKAQNVIDDAKLVGAEFNDMLRIFPDLTGRVHEANDALAEQAEEQRRLTEQQNAAARSILDYVNGLLAGPQSTLSPGARLDAAQATYGSQLTLARANNMEALGRITQDAENLRTALRDMFGSSLAYQQGQNQIISDLTGLPSVTRSADPVVAALRDTIAAIQAGNATQATEATLAGAVVTAINAGNASQIAALLVPKFDTLTATTGGGLNFSQFVAGLGPSYAGLATNATAGSLLTSGQLGSAGLATNARVNTLLTSDQLLSSGLATQATSYNVQNSAAEQLLKLQAIFNEIDFNHDGLISKEEAIRAATVGTQTNTGGIPAIGTNTGNTATNTGGIDAIERHTSIDGMAIDAQASKNLLSSINGLQSTATEHLRLMKDQLTNNAASVSFTVVKDDATTRSPSAANNLLTALNKIVINTYATSLNTYALVHFQSASKSLEHAIGVLGAGGLIGGMPHSQGGTNINAERGEYMLREWAASRIGLPALEFANRTGSLPVVPVPVRGANDNSSVVVELRAMRQQNERMEKMVGTLLGRIAHLEARGNETLEDLHEQGEEWKAQDKRLKGGLQAGRG